VSYFGSGYSNEGTIAGMIGYIIDFVLDPVVSLLIAAAVVVFLWGVVKYITSGDNEEERKKAKDLIIYGIIGLFVMVSVWGLVGLLTGTFDLNDDIPEIPKYTP
jgi:fumarate reductase subunit D